LPSDSPPLSLTLHYSADPLHPTSSPTRRSSDLLATPLWARPIFCRATSAALFLKRLLLLLVLSSRLARFHWHQVVLLRRLFGIQDRKSTRLNSSHVKTSYAVSCLQKKNADVRAT